MIWDFSRSASPRKAEVRNFRDSFCGHEHIARLDILVYETGFVRGVQAPGALNCHIQNLAQMNGNLPIYPAFPE